ncbi:unnamed protein product [Vitrella brassicaformis CCMP3155]|uniref:Uncharacterized protein n=2 Tax=Vitrella brassicaformis TaxID=1169539 RepID=A0A0G4FCW6_VITBC|nr:unnamed protein product [Vitrella brassicaformis CCMP3155]|mmetsp:Transcript_4252/g.9709  ORF Transcript_4252/g.9709 Transcript_4252/m.9709 type:complete len:288 (+) Transcript_4252:158-1021(+)|eukprot:CEM11065.1 unnamed protein product [Vitrella brassicaformis CCMP3155]
MSKLIVLTYLALAISAVSSAPSGLRGASDSEEHRQLQFGGEGVSVGGQRLDGGGWTEPVQQAGERAGEVVDEVIPDMPSNPREALNTAVELSASVGTGQLQFEAACTAAREYCRDCGVDEEAKDADVEYEVTGGTVCGKGAASDPFELPCGDVFWGEKIDEGDYYMAATAIAADIMGGSGTFTLAYIKDMVKRQIASMYADMAEYGDELLQQITDQLLGMLIDNPGRTETLFDSLKETRLELSFDIVTYSRAKCLHSPEDDSLITEVPLPNHHKPYFAIRLEENKAN